MNNNIYNMVSEQTELNFSLFYLIFSFFIICLAGLLICYAADAAEANQPQREAQRAAEFEFHRRRDNDNNMAMWLDGHRFLGILETYTYHGSIAAERQYGNAIIQMNIPAKRANPDRYLFVPLQPYPTGYPTGRP